jgi:hypothetical protein
VGNFALQTQSGDVLDVSGLGQNFAQFFTRTDSALAAVQNVSDLNKGDIATLGSGFAAEQLVKMDFLGFHGMDPEVVAAMFQQVGAPVGPSGPGGPGAPPAPASLQLNPEQWAGAFGAMNPEDIKGLGNVVGDAVLSLGAKDFLAIPPEQVLAMLQGSVLNLGPAAQAGQGLAAGAAAASLEQNLVPYAGKLDGMLGAMNFAQYTKIEDGQLLAMMQVMKADGRLGGEGSDLTTALQGKDVASLFGALDPANLKEFGGAGVLASIQGLQKGDFGDLDAKGALNIFNTVGPQGALGLANLGGIAGKFDAAGFKDLGKEGTFDIVKALEAGDFKALDALGANGACPILDHSQLGELGAQALASMITGVGKGASDLPSDHIQSYLQGFKAGDVGTLDKDVAGSLVGAAKDADLLILPPDVQGAYLITLGANLLGASGFGAGGAANTVFNIVPAGVYAGGSLAEAIGAGAPTLFGGNLLGGG